MDKITNFFKTRLCLNIFFLVIILWSIFGNIFHFDPYPYQFASTATNFLGFILMIVMNIAMKDQEDRHKDSHNELLESHKELHEKIDNLGCGD